MKLRSPALAVAAGTLCLSAAAAAHHSFAVFFDSSKTVQIEGKVTAYRFSNPHGTIALDVKKPNGSIEKWRVETTAPVVLRRRGWSRDSLHAGETVRITGWPAQDGTPYLRLQGAFDASGKPIGQNFRAGED